MGDLGAEYAAAVLALNHDRVTTRVQHGNRQRPQVQLACLIKRTVYDVGRLREGQHGHGDAFPPGRLVARPDEASTQRR
jgi:hypothetical protein